MPGGPIHDALKEHGSKAKAARALGIPVSTLKDRYNKEAKSPDTVLVIGDTHCPAMREGYIDFLKEVADRWQPTRVVHIGDLVDWHSISFHEKSPKNFGATEEAAEARKQIRKLVKAFPQVDWMVGNHDALPERQAAAVGIDPFALKGYSEYWQIPWVAHPRFAKLEIDGVLYAHGDAGAGGKFAALAQAMANFQSTVIGHYHSHAGVLYWANPSYRVFGMNVACGIDVNKHQFEYGVRHPAKPILGCGVVIHGVRPIFEPWLLESK